MRRKIKAVYFGKTELELLRWVEGRGNFSGYVKRLIKKDMSGNGDIRKIVEAILEKKGTNLPDDDFLKGIF